MNNMKLIKKLLLLLAVMAPLGVAHGAESRDTVWISDHYTTHMVFSTEINYADLSNQTVIAAKIIEVSKNKLAIKARAPFQVPASLAVEEADGSFHTYIVAYADEPGSLVMDMRPGGSRRRDRNMLETVELSDIYTTHLIFATDINYADLSSPSVLTGKLVDQGKNKLAIKAKMPFDRPANVTVEEANGVFHTYILKYVREPETLVLDTRERTLDATKRAQDTASLSILFGSREKEANVTVRKGVTANDLKRSDAPLLSEVVDNPQSLYHIGTKNYRLTLLCENIYSYSDITYLVFSLKNASSISYETGDATFVLESNNGSKRKIVYESNLFPKNKFGKLTTAPYSTSRMAYSFDKLTLSKDQVIKVYIYEKNGSRNLVLTLTDKDINGAVSPF